MSYNYQFGSNGFKKDLANLNQEYTDLDRVNYLLINPNVEPEPELEPEPEIQEIDKRLDLSYMNVKNIDQGIEWYKSIDSKIPDDLLPIMSRWSFGDLSKLTKKQIKNEGKKNRKKHKKESIIKFENKKCEVKFD